MHQKIVLCPSGKHTLVFAFGLHQNLLHSSLKTGGGIAAFFLHQRKKAVKALLHYIMRYLVFFCFYQFYFVVKV